jgi:membrane-bound lytic murein transglycosylase F
MFSTMRSLAGLILLLAVLAGCDRLPPPGPEQPLLVGLPADPVFQQPAPNSEGMNGFSRDLVDAFADSLGVGVRFVIAPDTASLLTMLREGKVHMAAAVPAVGNDPTLSYSPPLRESRQLIVQQAGALPVGSADKLAGREIAVLPGAPQIQTLKELNITPPPVVVERPGIDELELLSDVARNRHALAASDELHLTIASNFNPDLGVALELPGKLTYVWAFAARNPELRELRKQAGRFIEDARQDGTLARLDDRYFGHIRRMDAEDIGSFIDDMRNRLPDFRNLFKEAQEITGIDWRLLAALAYQESKWNPLATSPTGVRGMMMLTEDTADRMEVSNRLDPKQSIRAGAKYLAMLMDDLPESIKHPDRLWFALAAYNLGMGHLNGARSFAPGLKRSPDLWYDMKQVLPLMSRPEYYSRLKSGRARGGEAVILVENIRNFYDVLSRFEPVYTPPSLSSGTPKAKTKKKVPPKPKPKPPRAQKAPEKAPADNA